MSKHAGSATFLKAAVIALLFGAIALFAPGKALAASPQIALDTTHIHINLKDEYVDDRINVSCKNYDDVVYFEWESEGNDGYADLVWGDWDKKGTTCPLVITGRKKGSFSLRLRMIDNETGDVLDETDWIPVWITTSYLEIMEENVDLKVNESRKIMVSDIYFGEAKYYNIETKNDKKNVSFKYRKTYREGGSVVLPVTLKGLKMGSVQMRVTIENKKHEAIAESNWVTVNVCPNGTKLKKVSYSTGDKKLNVSWKKVKGVSGYEVEISTKKSFAKPAGITTSATKASFSVKKGKTYYVRVRSYYKSGKTKVYSEWSKVLKKAAK